MSAASTPAPSARPPSRITFFLPNLIVILALLYLMFNQLTLLEDTLDQTTKAADKIDQQVKVAKHHKAMFFGLARDLLAISDSDPNAESIAKEYKLHEMKANNPAPFNAPPEDELAAASNNTSSTNTPSTNAPTATPPAPAK